MEGVWLQIQVFMFIYKWTELCLLHGALSAAVIALLASLLLNLPLWHCEVPQNIESTKVPFVSLLCWVQKNRNRNSQ